MFLTHSHLLAAIAGGASYAMSMWFWLVALASLAVTWMFVETPGQDRAHGQNETPADAHPSFAPRCLPEQDQPEVVREVMDVQEALVQEGVEAFRGHLRKNPDEAFEKLKQSSGNEVVPMMQEDPQFGEVLLLVPKPVASRERAFGTHPLLHLFLLLATIATTMYAGAAQQGVDLLQEPARFIVGLPYAFGLLAILGVHEFGHYFAARLHKIRVTLPYFIPVPFALGTFGAFIRMKSPTEDRRSLLDVAVAGPIAGLLIAIPILLLGLQHSAVVPLIDEPSEGIHAISAGSSILFALLSRATLGSELQNGYLVAMSPLAFAGWLGLFITALNLLPIGQLDGGHIARAMFGHRVGSAISTISLLSLFLLGLFVWPTMLIWAIIVFFVSGRSTPPLNDVSHVTPTRVVVGAISFCILFSILIPLPHVFYDAVGIGQL